MTLRTAFHAAKDIAKRHPVKTLIGVGFAVGAVYAPLGLGIGGMWAGMQCLVAAETILKRSVVTLKPREPINMPLLCRQHNAWLFSGVCLSMISVGGLFFGVSKPEPRQIDQGNNVVFVDVAEQLIDAQRFDMASATKRIAYRSIFSWKTQTFDVTRTGTLVDNTEPFRTISFGKNEMHTFIVRSNGSTREIMKLTQ